jgi:hypothetical protein
MKYSKLFVLSIVALLILGLPFSTVYAQEVTPEPTEPVETPEPLETPEPEETPETDDSIFTGQNPVAAFIASITQMEYEQVRAYQEEGLGLGNMTKAYYFLQAYQGEEAMDFAMVANMANEIGWGELFKNAGMHPGGGHGVGWLFKETGEKPKPENSGKPEWVTNGPPDHANNDKDNPEKPDKHD